VKHGAAAVIKFFEREAARAARKAGRGDAYAVTDDVELGDGDTVPLLSAQSPGPAPAPVRALRGYERPESSADMLSAKERFLKAMEAMAQQKAEATPVQEQAGDNGSPDSKRAVGGGDAGLALDFQVSCRHVPCPVAASLPPCPGIV